MQNTKQYTKSQLYKQRQHYRASLNTCNDD